ncbi:MAG: efflux RND transporter permease subunit [Rhodospirillales bacterium]
MTLPEISIRRPVFATVLSLAITLIGLISYQRLTVREYPNIDEPVVTVQTTYRGASAEIIESQITVPLEDSLSGIDGIDVLSSVSRDEVSQITVRFRLNRDPDGAAADVRDRVGRVRKQLPDDIDEPVIAKVEADAQPIIYMAFSSDKHSPLEISDYADRYVKDRLQNIPGVSGVRIFGERRYSMRLWLDPVRLAAYKMTPQDVENALRSQNVEIPAGRIESQSREFTIVAQTDLRSAKEFENIVLRNSDGYLVRLSDVGRAELGPADTRSIVRFNGKTAVAIGVIKQATANPLDVSQGVRNEMPRILAEAPDGMSVGIAYDSSVFIEKSIDNVFRTIGEAMALVVLVIFLFLRSWRATIIPLVTIPVSLIGAFTIMLLFGFSINTLTLLAMVLAIGLVVDDSIVMLENISRYVEQGMKPFDAALKGAREIAFAVIAMSVTLAAVYVPVAFQTGRTGRLFAEFALTLAGAVIVSGFAALTLSPMMSSLLLKHQTHHGLLFRLGERALDGLNAAYRAALSGVLKIKPVVVVVWLVVGATAVLTFTSLPNELSPLEDRGVIYSVAFAPEGSTMDYTFANARKIEDYLFAVPEVETAFFQAGYPFVNRASSFARLKDWDQRDVKQQTIVAALQPKLSSIPGVNAFPNNPPSLGQSPADTQVQFVLQTSGSYDNLQKAMDQLIDALRANPNIQNADTDLKLNKPRINIAMDRDKAADLGISIDTIGRTLETMMGGRQVTRFKQNSKQYDVIVQIADVDRTNPDKLTSIFVRSASGQMIPLSNLVKFNEGVAPRELNHFNKLRSATLKATLAPGYALGDALKFLQDQVRNLPAGITYDLGGQSREFRTASGGFLMLLLLAMIFIYLVLAAQFESFIDPLIIMLTVPMSLTGALLALKLTGGTINVYSQIGLVTLVGLITKHGILIVEFSNQLRDQGRSKLQAVVEASALRLRPILMTTGAMVLGSIPLAIAQGAGAESRQQIGWVIVGGLLLGTVLTLFVVPTAYMLLSGSRERHARSAKHAAAANKAGQPPAHTPSHDAAKPGQAAE